MHKISPEKWSLVLETIKRFYASESKQAQICAAWLVWKSIANKPHLADAILNDAHAIERFLPSDILPGFISIWAKFGDDVPTDFPPPKTEAEAAAAERWQKSVQSAVTHMATFPDTLTPGEKGARFYDAKKEHALTVSDTCSIEFFRNPNVGKIITFIAPLIDQAFADPSVEWQEIKFSISRLADAFGITTKGARKLLDDVFYNQGIPTIKFETKETKESGALWSWYTRQKERDFFSVKIFREQARVWGSMTLYFIPRSLYKVNSLHHPYTFRLGVKLCANNYLRQSRVRERAAAAAGTYASSISVRALCEAVGIDLDAADYRMRALRTVQSFERDMSVPELADNIKWHYKTADGQIVPPGGLSFAAFRESVIEYELTGLPIDKIWLNQIAATKRRKAAAAKKGKKGK